MQLWATNSLGGFFYSLNLSKELREALQPSVKFRQFCDMRDASTMAKGKGQTFTWDVVSDVVTAGGTLVETNTMPETNFTITQATLTVTEYGNSVPYSGKLEDLSQFEVKRPVMSALKNDATKVLDSAAYTQFNSAALRVVATTETATFVLFTNGTATGSNTIAYSSLHHRALMDTMRERNIPSYQGDDYVAIARPAALRSVKNHMESLEQYTERGLAMIFNGEIGRYENCRFVQQTNQPLESGGTAWGATPVSGWIFFLGEDTVGEGVVVPEEMRAKIPTDYGRSKGVAWYALLGFGIVHTAAAQSRIVKWDTQGGA
jgi:N4-gp56 family major capsid protein